jgi:hypothetical protein
MRRRRRSVSFWKEPLGDFFNEKEFCLSGR